ncbi:lipase family protein [Nocardia sp. NPDC050697]|uniref:lipase family protein n=1 Tax=Nocardia sp. NPDC050697 TaxID=3155158 RepID=UPI0033CC8BEA
MRHLHSAAELTRLRGFAVAAVAACGIALCAPAAVAAPLDPVYPAFDQDAFRSPPPELGALPPGRIVAARPVTARLDGVALSGVRAWQISFRSSDSHDRPVLGVTTLLVPDAEWTGPGARPLVSQQLAYDSAAPQCAPSVGMAASAGDPRPLLGHNWAVAVPDHEGPRAAFMAGIAGGRLVLDGIRAVRAFAEAGIGPDSPLALDGYSGGAQPSAWAAESQSSYAPELTFTGAAFGGLPADPAAVARQLDGTAFSGLMFAALAGMSAEYPEAGIAELLNDEGRRVLDAMRAGCADIVPGYAFRRLAEHSVVPDPIAEPGPAAVLAANVLGRTAPPMPVYDYHAAFDEVVPLAQADAVVEAWCATGAQVLVHRSITEHISSYQLDHAGAVQYLAERFAGLPARDDCAS